MVTGDTALKRSAHLRRKVANKESRDDDCGDNVSEGIRIINREREENKNKMSVEGRKN